MMMNWNDLMFIRIVTWIKTPDINYTKNKSMYTAISLCIGTQTVNKIIPMVVMNSIYLRSFILPNLRLEYSKNYCKFKWFPNCVGLIKQIIVSKDMRF